MGDPAILQPAIDRFRVVADDSAALGVDPLASHELLECHGQSEFNVLTEDVTLLYFAAVLVDQVQHEIAGEVFSIEIVGELAESARRILVELGYQKAHVRHGNGYLGWPEEAPFDAIIVTCAAGHLPPPLWEQLKPLGRIVIPIGGPYELQRLVVMTKNQDGTRRSRTVISVRFVPMTRRESS